MDKVSATVRFTVFFQEPFWIGVAEVITNGRLAVCKATFGAEPKDYEVYQFILENYYKLRFSPAVETDTKEMRINPKRMQREVHQQVQETGIGTKSQQALKLQQEERKTERKERNHEQKIMEKQRQFEWKQQKKKEKHRGR